MMTVTLTLTEFPLARIAEDEAAAREATPGPWTAYGDGVVLGESANPEVCREVKTWNMWHIGSHDPIRVLADCAAKRRIGTELETIAGLAFAGPLDSAESAQSYASGLQLALRHLATPHAAHPDYRNEWHA